MVTSKCSQHTVNVLYKNFWACSRKLYNEGVQATESDCGKSLHPNVFVPAPFYLPSFSNTLFWYLNNFLTKANVVMACNTVEILSSHFLLIKMLFIVRETRRVSQPQNWYFGMALHQFVVAATICGRFRNFSNFYLQNKSLKMQRQLCVRG